MDFGKSVFTRVIRRGFCAEVSPGGQDLSDIVRQSKLTHSRAYTRDLPYNRDTLRKTDTAESRK
jgi:hypothetical protein